ncbi:MAG: hotdog fold thioesterase, partial [Mycobacterium sp.]
ARAVARVLRAGRRSIVAQVDVFRSGGDELAATATVNFAVVNRGDVGDVGDTGRS